MAESNLQSSRVKPSQLELLDASEFESLGQEIRLHLRQESAFLDRLLHYSTTLTALLRPSRSATRSESMDDRQARAEVDPVEMIRRIRTELASQFEPLAAGRRSLEVILGKMGLEVHSASLREIAGFFSATLGDELHQLRNEIRHKLDELQTITLGNQAVLIYRLDFHHRMLNGIAGQTRSADSYNAYGQKLPSTSSRFVQTHC